MRTLRRTALGLVLAGLWAGSALPVLAADSGTVEATVTVATPCLIVTPNQVDFGTLPFSAIAGPLSSGVESVSYTNCSEASQRVYGRGTDATGGSGTEAFSWTLTSLPACGSVDNPVLNQYALVAADGVNPATPLSLTDQQLEVVAGGAQGTVSMLGLYMPCAGSDGVGAIVSFQAIFTATF